MEYITYKESTTSEKKRREHNQIYIKENLIKQKEYFDNMFSTIDSNIKLDEEQRKIILTDEDYVMVIAGAGSGKTTTISAKVNYLIEKKKIKDEEIMVISFTNKAVKELNERINKDFKHNVKIVTFHKFGYEIIKNNTTNPPKIIKNNTEIIKKYIEKELINNEKKLKQFLNLYIYYFDISEEYQIFKNFDEYNKYKNKQKYPTLKNKIEYINNTIKEQQNNNKTINNEHVKNLNEALIANFLYMNNITYKYQQSYPYLETYQPDFTIYKNDKICYIEYFNMNKINKFKYEKNIKMIRNIHKKYKTNIIEIYDNQIIETLKQELENKKIKLKERKTIEIFNKLIKENQDITYKKFINFCNTFINLFKSKGYEYKDFDKIQTNNTRTKIFIQFIKELYQYYQKQLERNNQIDFDDMINKANKIITTNKNIHLQYKYIIIDEYQDISDCRFKLIKNISEKTKSKIMVVGDDWQCIYSFAASNINLFTNFKNNVDYCEILKITKTYRNSKELINIAGKFIQQNKNQIRKNLISNKTLKYPITILKYKNKKIKQALHQTLEYIINKYGEEKNILILGRYTFDKNKIIDNKTIIEQNTKIIYKKYEKVKIEFMTIHSSKGLGYDNIIIINTLNDILGFPSKIKTDPILEQLITKDENIKYAEERRLFYVALTRTKNEVIILTPKYNSSIFIKEIKKSKNIKIKSNIFKIKQ